MENKAILLSEIFLRQMTPSFVMIKKMIANCPKSIWAQRNISPPVWQQIYHVLYGLDYWFSVSKKDFVAPQFGEEVNSVLGEESKGIIDQEEMIGYLDYVQNKVFSFISSINDQSIKQPSQMYKRWTNLDVILEQLRHLQHHLGYLNRVLLKCKISPAEWEFFDI